MQALSAKTQVRDNVAFNGPRAAVSFTDGFGGGHVVDGNLFFDFVRETSDHGLFNSWDRQVVCICVCLCVCLSVCLCVSVFMSVCLPVSVPVYLSVSVCL
jgi:hypothetical protein